jgi:hypothetical protein
MNTEGRKIPLPYPHISCTLEARFLALLTAIQVSLYEIQGQRLGSNLSPTSAPFATPHVRIPRLFRGLIRLASTTETVALPSSASEDA